MDICSYNPGITVVCVYFSYKWHFTAPSGHYQQNNCIAPTQFSW